MADQARPIRLIQENRGDSSIRLNKALRIGKYKVAFEQNGKSWPLPTSLSARPLVSLLAKILRQPETCQRHHAGRVLNLSVFLAGIIHLEAEFGLSTINLVAELIAEAPSGTWWRQTLDAFA